MRDFGIEVFDLWTAMWNGELELAERIMAPRFTLRYAQPGAVAYDAIHDPAAFARQIAEFRRSMPGLRFEVQGDAVVDLGEGRTGLVARPYGACRPGADGDVRVSGTDILRLDAGLIVEVWSVSGGLHGRPYYPATAA
ncbi:SnoaL-like domain-containing protein [Nocardia nova SH22a]|uniref:SnoaL-like domain-containing protein n=1 Tax=Nocardia nova SH22a TaxID=1415166 RepID=W5TFA9_9NOCA|nr:nuclear transport factor 2 family protein [Nocardia nova]AHH18035.1 SnoaL-like domain-containing protein [Nocardia nova SH22a]